MSSKIAARRPWLLAGAMLSVLALLLPAAARPQNNNCDALMKALAVAQGDYNRAVAAWRQAGTRLSQAEAKVKNINSELKRLDNTLIRLEAALDQAMDDKADCDKAERDGSLAPLHDCAGVPARVAKARKDLADAQATHEKLLADLAKAEAEVEQREDENASAHAAERQAWGVLEDAKRAAAGCKRAA